MITFCRTASVAPGQTNNAIKFAKTIQAYFKETYAVQVDVAIPFGGNPMRLCWTSQYPDMASLDAMFSKIMADQQYWKIVNDAKDCMLPGSVEDSIWRSI